MAEITLVTSSDGDWEGVYADGRLVTEDHSVAVDHLLRSLKGAAIDDVFSIEVDGAWMSDQIHLPINLGEIPQEVRA